MSRAKKTGNLVLASAAAALLASAPVKSYAAENEENMSGKCWGVNSCKGSSNCKTATSACAGKNACKSEGFLKMKFKQCQELGGDFEPVSNT